MAAALVMHSRMRFILNLLPHLQNASSLRRVVSVGAATCEGPIDTDDIPGLDFPLRRRRDQIASVQTLLLEEMARRAPDVSFVHTVPGVVRSGIGRDAEGLGMAALLAISRLLGPLIGTPPAECGERHVFFATSAMYPPREGEAVAGVPLLAGGGGGGRDLSVARGSDGNAGSGMYSVNNKCESAPPRVEQLLAEFRENGTAQVVWDYVATDLKRITGTEVAP